MDGQGIEGSQVSLTVGVEACILAIASGIPVGSLMHCSVSLLSIDISTGKLQLAKAMHKGSSTKLRRGHQWHHHQVKTLE